MQEPRAHANGTAALPADDASRCPRGHRCESCGDTGPGLAVVLRHILAEVLCLTMCARCAASGRPPAIMLSTAERLVAQHRRHLVSRGSARRTLERL